MLWAAFCVIWISGTAYVTYGKVAPMLIKKRVTVSIANVGTVRVIFSNSQPDNEVIYEMKSLWTPRLENDASAFVGREFTEPYETYLKHHRTPVVRTAIGIGLAPFVLWGAVWGIGALVLRKRKQCT